MLPIKALPELIPVPRNRRSLPEDGNRTITTRVEGKRHSRIEITSGPIKELFKRFGQPDGKGGYRIGSKFSDHIAAIKNRAASILRTGGLPDVPNVYFTKSAPGTWQTKVPPEADFAGACSIDYYVRQRGFARDSRQDLAARILATTARMEANPSEAPRLAFELGQLCMLLRVYAAESAPGRKGGSLGPLTKRQRATEWRRKVAPAVKRYIAEGRSDSNIGALLTGVAGKTARTVAGYAAVVRRELARSEKSAK